MKKKMKLKKKSVIILIISVIIICALIIFLIKYNNSLKGEKVTDGVYLYSIKTEDYHLTTLKVIKDNIYFLNEDNRTYTLYKQNIYRNSSSKVGKIDGENDYCLLYDKYILCLNNDTNNYYDYNLKLLYSEKYDEDNKSHTLYHQNKFLKLIDNKIYDGNKVYRELDFNDKDAYYMNDVFVNNSSYLVYYSSSKKIYYYYDITNNSYEKLDDSLWSTYNKGLYTARDGKILVFNLVDNKITNYDDISYDKQTFVTAMSDNLFYFTDEDNRIYEIDLDKKTISVIDYKIDPSVTTVVRYENYLYLVAPVDKNDVYIIDLDKITKHESSISDYQAYMDNTVKTKVEELENKYHIDIVYKDDVNINNNTFKTTPESNNYLIIKALDSTEKFLKKFNAEFFDKFKDDEHKGIVLYLSGRIISNDKADTTPNPVGYNIRENNQYEMVIDITDVGLDNTLCHELMHSIEMRLSSFDYSSWFNKNPKNYVYEYSYRTNTNSKYTKSEDNKNNVYFVDEYSKSYPTEDIARIFENVCSTDTKSMVLDYPHLKEKALFLKDIILKEFPSLKDATVFNSLNETK